MRFWHKIALAAVALLAASPALADERILDFSSAVAVQPDGALDVEEKILVRAENVAINHGIFRDFPTRYRGRAGARVRVDFKLIETRRDGQSEPSATEAISNGVRIRMGSADLTVPPGEHLYTIHYRTNRQIGRFADYDELYWNVTGNGWDFPIDQASVRITLPSPAKFGQRAVYTGPQGSTDSYGRVVDERPGEIAFQTTAPLAPHEGFTVAVAWPKGVIAAETSDDRTRYWLADNGPTLVGALALLGLLAYYFYAWKRIGRGPLAGTVVPIFSPPDDLSPAAMRYVWKMKADNRSFAAALVDMGVRGHIKLVEKDGGWFSSDTTTIVHLPGAHDPLPAAEQALATALFTGDDAIEMDKKNHTKFSSAQNGLSEELKETYEGRLFLRNWSWSLVGLALFIASLGITAMALLLAEGAYNPSLLAMAVGAALVAVLCFAAGRRIATGGRCALNGVAMLSALIAAALIVPMLPLALATGRFLPLLLPLLALPFVVSAFAWMAAPTKEGRGVLDRIAGFRQYLSIAERNRLDRMTAPADTLDRFERFLPYAIALGVETQWAKRFQSQLAAAAAAAQSGSAQGFAWYSGSSNPWDNPGGFAREMGSSLASAVSSASTAPGSSSGSGGGGSSGGGGGGGGGGGW